MESLMPFNSDLQQRLSYPDPNNNGEKISMARGEKYSLRPRSMRRGRHHVDEEDIPAPNPIQEQKSRSGRQQKPKQKPAPLSKYRRKTANARERTRMREINTAFETLRCAVPHLQQCTSGPSASANEKLTKITTLRLAMKYISALSSALRDTGASSTSSGNGTSSIGSNLTCGSDLSDLLSDCSDLDCLLLESDGESLPLSDHSLLASPGFSDPGLSPCNFDDPNLPSLLHTDFADSALTTTEFSEFFLT